MDYVSIVKQLVLLIPDGVHKFKNAWPEGVDFPEDWGEEILCTDIEKKILRQKSLENGQRLKHAKCLFTPLTKFDVDLTFRENGTISSVSWSGGFNHNIKIWQDFNPDNPIVPELLNKAMTIIHGKDWMKDIPAKVTYIAPRVLSFVKAEKL